MRQKAIIFGLLATSCLLIPLRVVADYIPPGEVEVETIPYTPSYSEVAEGRYYYDVSWQGIPVASASISVERSSFEGEPHLLAVVAAKSAQVIDWVYRMRHHSETFMRSEDFRPLSFYSRNQENSRRKVRQVLFTKDKIIKARRWKNGKERESLEFVGGPLTVGPISGAFLAKSLPIQVGSKRSFDVFNGDHRYLITFHVKGIEDLEVGDKGETRKCFRVVPEVKKLTDTKGERRLKSATLWISADEKREILRLESSVLVGSVVAQFNRFEPSARLPDGAVVQARARLSETLTAP